MTRAARSRSSASTSDSGTRTRACAVYAPTAASCSRACYCLQLGLLPLPKTANPAHVANNAEVNFEISAAHMDALKAAEHIRDYSDSSFFPVFGGKL